MAPTRHGRLTGVGRHYDTSNRRETVHMKYAAILLLVLSGMTLSFAGLALIQAMPTEASILYAFALTGVGLGYLILHGDET